MRRPSPRALVAGLAVAFLAMQLVPYGREHPNPPVTMEPPWDTPETRALAERACFDCHSHETDWPWYSWIAPLSWQVQRDVVHAREHLDFSAWDVPQSEAGEAAETVDEGTMPPWWYELLHPDRRLTEAEKARLAAGLRTTITGNAGEPLAH